MTATTSKAFVALANKLENRELLHDAIKRKVPRPQDTDWKRNLHSSNRRRHTVRNAVIAAIRGVV